MKTTGPQIEDGNFTRIHNDILEAITLGKFTIREYKCLLFLLRKTYGWQKKAEHISLSQWEQGTGIKKQNVAKALANLSKRNVIYRDISTGGRGKSSKYSFNKYFDKWCETVSLGIQNKTVSEGIPFSKETVSVGITETVSVGIHTKEKKETSKQASSPVGDYLAVFREHFGKPNRPLIDVNNFDYGKIVYWAEKVTLEGFTVAMTKTASVHPSRIWNYAEKILSDYAVNGYGGSVTKPTTVDISMEELQQ